MGILARLVRAPLLRMVALGTVLLAGWRLVAPATPRTLVVTAAQVRATFDDFRRRSGRDPTPAEEALLVQQLVDDELLYHEALVLGLERGDLVVRRRMRQKMETLLQGIAPPPEPTDAELLAHRDAHPDRWLGATRYTLDHVFVSAERRGDRAPVDAAMMGAELARGAGPATIGDPFPQGARLVDRTEAQLAGILSAPAAAAVRTLEPGVWSRPLRSGRGLHLVRVVERVPGESPPLERIRPALRDEWMADARARALADAIGELVRRYDVRIAPDDPAG